MRLCRSLLVALAALAAIVSFASSSTVARAAQTPAERTVAYETISNRYFVKNDVPVRPRTFFIIRDFATFASIFGYGAVMGPAPRATVSAADFSGRTMLIAIASGPLCTLGATSVSAAGPHFTVAFTSHCDAPGSATYSVPLVLSVAAKNVGSATFVENGHIAGYVRTVATPMPAPRR
jgi:hypothetical protein